MTCGGTGAGSVAGTAFSIPTSLLIAAIESFRLFAVDHRQKLRSMVKRQPVRNDHSQIVVPTSGQSGKVERTGWVPSCANRML